MRRVARLWNQFVTADGVAYTLGRLALALVISVLFFPFGIGVVVTLWALGIPVKPALAIGAGFKDQPARRALRILTWIFVAALIFPTVLGAVVNLLGEAGARTLGTALGWIFEYSLFPSGIQSWIDAYGKNVHRSAQYAVCSAVICVGLALTLAELMRMLTHFPNSTAGGYHAKGGNKFLGGCFFLAVIGCVLGPLAFFALPAASSHDAGLVGPGDQLAGSALPFVIVPAWGMLLGALTLWLGLAILISRQREKRYDH